MLKKAVAALVIVAVWPIVWAIGKLDAIVLEGPDPYGEYEREDWDDEQSQGWETSEPDDDE
jgi:hypothetical protein